MKSLQMTATAVLLLLLGLAFTAAPAAAFCGFYVAQADTDLFNQASKVVLVRDGDRTVVTMANDYQGAPEEFALVVPVPTFLERGQIHVSERAVIDHLDAYTAPRLVEYRDSNPCVQRPWARQNSVMESSAIADDGAVGAAKKSFGVTIEAQYSVGEYDILILSAKESDGLEGWLRQNGYRLPEGASQVLGSYIKQNMRFFVARVNLEKQAKLGYSFLRPLQVAYESNKFMLPIRLGTINANGPQELFVFVLNRTGRVETTNYRTVRLPTGMDLPEYVDQDFGGFYKALFDHQVRKQKMRTVFLEYAWDMGWCDPCAANPLSRNQLKQLGVFWLPDHPARQGPAAQNVFVTRLHLRYTAETFPDDLRFQETGDRQNFQGRYVIRRPWPGQPNQCAAAKDYFRQLAERRRTAADNLASLTGWNLTQIHQDMDFVTTAPISEETPPSEETPWWKKLWGE